jgi:3'-phosphoadenosine 5'-phosphosulfate sulfotransferase (PAPS reductase)/FAD synthetase
MEHYLAKKPGWAAVSGGRTSGYMLARIIGAHRVSRTPIPDGFAFFFCNTGLEDERTYRFVERMAIDWGVNIRWLEYERTSEPVVRITGNSFQIGCHGVKEVDFHTASRNGEPFRKVIEVRRDFRAIAKGLGAILPNPAQRFCSGELKERTMARFYESQFGKVPRVEMVGIRADEESRVAGIRKKQAAFRDIRAPLVDDHVDEDDVLSFWANNDFDLEIPNDPELGTYYGNCVGCFLKNKKKMARIAAGSPQDLEWFAAAEEEFGVRFRNDRPSYREIINGAIPLPVCQSPPEEDEEETACSCTD